MWSDERFPPFDGGLVDVCVMKQMLWGFCLALIWHTRKDKDTQSTGSRTASKMAYQAEEEVLYAALDCDNLFPADICAGALESTVKTVSTIEQAHASLFRFEMADWRWDTRVENAARAHYQDIDEWALRRGWTWDFDGFNEVVRGLVSFQESDREHGCLCEGCCEEA